MHDSFAIEAQSRIEEGLKEAIREKEALQSEIQANEEKIQNDISICEAETNFIDKISEQLMQNMEEEWEIKEAILEIKELELRNKEEMNRLVNEMEEMVIKKDLITQNESLNEEERKVMKEEICMLIQEKL